MGVRKQKPTKNGITYIEFSLSNLDYPFVAASAVGGGQIMLEEIIPRGEGRYAEFYTVSETDPDEVLALAEEHGSVEMELLARYEDGGLFEFVVSENCPAVFLGEQGALPRRVESIAGEGRIAAEVPAVEDSTTIIDRFLSAHQDARLVMKRQQPYSTPLFSHREFQNVIEDQLTDRQREVLATAHEAGYYDWPRETTGEELAEDFGVSTSTIHEHLRAAEQKLIAWFFDPPTVKNSNDTN